MILLYVRTVAVSFSIENDPQTYHLGISMSFDSENLASRYTFVRAFKSILQVYRYSPGSANAISIIGGTLTVLQNII